MDEHSRFLESQLAGLDALGEGEGRVEWQGPRGTTQSGWRCLNACRLR